MPVLLVAPALTQPRRSSAPTQPIRAWALAAVLATVLLQSPPALASVRGDLLFEQRLQEQEQGNMEDVPSALRAGDSATRRSSSSAMRGGNAKAISGCTSSCLTSCVRGGPGAPGLGPAAQGKEVAQFRGGFRSRNYCLTTCVDACAAVDRSGDHQRTR